MSHTKKGEFVIKLISFPQTEFLKHELRIFIIIFGICTCCQLLITGITLQLDFTLVEHTYL